jgi:adhesin/invasin
VNTKLVNAARAVAQPSPRTKLLKKTMLSAWLVALTMVIGAVSAAASDLVITPNTLAFVAVQGTNPPSQTVNAYPSVAGTAIAPTFSSNVPWIALSGASAGSLTASMNVFVAVSTLGLGPGFYNGQVTIGQAGFTKSPQVVGINLEILAPGISYIASPTVLEVSALTGANASSQFFAVTTLGSVTVKPSLTATTSAGGNWIALSAPVTSTLNTVSTVQVNFNTSGLATGFYTGVITVAGTGVQNSPVSIPVNLTIGTSTTAPTLAPSPANLSFTTVTGANPATAILTINNSGPGTIFPVLTTSTTDGNPWLEVALNDPPGAGGSVTATVSINDASLPNGSYSGSITIKDGSAINSPMVIPVALSVQTANPVLSLGATGFTFNAAAGSTQSATSNVAISNAGTGALNFNAVASTTSGGNWLSVSPATGLASSTLTVTVNPTGLAAGVYSGAIVVSTIGTQTSQTIQVLFGVGVSVAAINLNGITNGASFASSIVAPGEIVSLFGVNLGPATGQSTLAAGGLLATSQAGISVTVGGTPAPLYFVGANQINLQVPWEVAGNSSTPVVVSNNGQSGLPFTLQLRPVDPAVFVASNGSPAVLNQAGAQITSSNPASAGQVLSLYATGLGPVSPAIKTGQLAPVSGALYNTAAQATVTVGASNASVSFSGLAPGYVGLYQINFAVPAGLAAGNQVLVIGVGNITSPALTLAVH